MKLKRIFDPVLHVDYGPRHGELCQCRRLLVRNLGQSVYYGSTNYEDLYDAGYNYGARNQIDYDIPEIQYGLSQEFLETSLNNPYLSSGIQYGLSGGSATTVYPESDFSNSSIISGGSLIEVPYQPSVTITDLKQKDGSIGKVSIDRVSLSCKVYEGATDSSMSKGAGHYTSSGIYTGNIGLFGHNRGSHAYFAKLKNVKIGDIVEYKTAIGTKTYQVTFCRVHLLYRLFVPE